MISPVGAVSRWKVVIFNRQFFASVGSSNRQVVSWFKRKILEPESKRTSIRCFHPGVSIKALLSGQEQCLGF